jgi:hypothetical protein
MTHDRYAAVAVYLIILVHVLCFVFGFYLGDQWGKRQ